MASSTLCAFSLLVFFSLLISFLPTTKTQLQLQCIINHQVPLFTNFWYRLLLCLYSVLVPETGQSDMALRRLRPALVQLLYVYVMTSLLDRPCHDMASYQQPRFQRSILPGSPIQTKRLLFAPLVNTQSKNIILNKHEILTCKQSTNLLL